MSEPRQLLDLTERLGQVGEMHTNCGGSTTLLGAYWEGYREGLLFAKRMYDSEAALAAGVQPSVSPRQKNDEDDEDLARGGTTGSHGAVLPHRKDGESVG